MKDRVFTVLEMIFPLSKVTRIIFRLVNFSVDKVYPVGNTHLKYYEDVMDYFEQQGFEPEESEILTVGADLIGWNLQDRYPDASVGTLEINPKTSSVQYEVGERLLEDENPLSVVSDVRKGVSGFDHILDWSDEVGNIYPEIVLELGNDVARPRSGSVGDFADYGGDADVVLTNNVSDYMNRGEFLESLVRTDASYAEMYSVLPGLKDELDEIDAGFDLEFDPDVSFQWEGLEGVTVVLFS